MSFEIKPLSSLIELQRGHDLPSRERTEGTVPVIGSFGVTGWHNVERYAGPGVAIGRSGASIGRATYVSQAYWPLNTCLFVRDFKGNDPRWTYWMLHSLDFAAYNSGSAQPSLNRNYLAQIGVPTPSVRQQTLIGEMLGALDDKIASNNRVNALGMSLLLAKYRAVPKGRGGVNFEEVALVGGGATPSTKKPELWGQGVLWATPTDVTALDGVWLDRTERTISPVGLDSISSPLYPVGSIAMTSRATIGACALLGEPMAVNQGFIVLQPKQDSRRHWLYCQLFDRVEELKAWANGATFLELPKKIFRQLPVDLGSESDMDEFAQFATPLVERLHVLQRENWHLATTRDELLPLLMSGKITVKDAEKTVEEVV